MPKHHDTIQVEQLDCVVQYYNFSPKGGLEGLLVKTGRTVAQVVCPPHLSAALARAVAEGDKVRLSVSPAQPSDKGEAEHPMYELLEVPGTDRAEPDVPVAGTVARLNYAKHGEANGVVLDSGDFVHLKPDGMRQLKLKVGDVVTAVGETRPMDLGHRVMEAASVNGMAVKARAKPAHKAKGGPKLKAD